MENLPAAIFTNSHKELTPHVAVVKYLVPLGLVLTSIAYSCCSSFENMKSISKIPSEPKFLATLYAVL